MDATFPQKASRQVYAFCLMRNHYYVLLETSKADSVAGWHGRKPCPRKRLLSGLTGRRSDPPTSVSYMTIDRTALPVPILLALVALFLVATPAIRAQTL